jgi:hypothetical protein
MVKMLPFCSAPLQEWTLRIGDTETKPADRKILDHVDELWIEGAQLVLPEICLVLIQVF